MARNKIKLEYVKDRTARRVTFNKRSKGVIKKTQELCILCGITACAIIYGVYDQAPLIWPESEAEVRRILMRYRQRPEADHEKKNFDLGLYLRNAQVKAKEKLLRLQRKRRDVEAENIMCDLFNGKPIEQVPFSDMPNLICMIDDRLRSVQHQIRVMGGDPATPPDPISYPNLAPEMM